MSKRLAVAAVIAAHRGFDDAETVAIRSGRQRDYCMTGVQTSGRRSRRLRIGGMRTSVFRDRVTDQRAKFLLGHSRAST